MLYSPYSWKKWYVPFRQLIWDTGGSWHLGQGVQVCAGSLLVAAWWAWAPWLCWATAAGCVSSLGPMLNLLLRVVTAISKSFKNFLIRFKSELLLCNFSKKIYLDFNPLLKLQLYVYNNCGGRQSSALVLNILLSLTGCYIALITLYVTPSIFSSTLTSFNMHPLRISLPPPYHTGHSVFQVVIQAILILLYACS